MTKKKSRSGSGSISQRHGSADPDPNRIRTKISWIRNTATLVRTFQITEFAKIFLLRDFSPVNINNRGGARSGFVSEQKVLLESA
jgi:hypothetical protein